MKRSILGTVTVIIAAVCLTACGTGASGKAPEEKTGVDVMRITDEEGNPLVPEEAEQKTAASAAAGQKMAASEAAGQKPVASETEKKPAAAGTKTGEAKPEEAIPEEAKPAKPEDVQAAVQAVSDPGVRETEPGEGYIRIDQETAKKMMDTETDFIILDVRKEDEFAEGHIPGAMLIPDFLIKQKAEEMLPDKDRLILVYCRSGNRSKRASKNLAAMGYTNVYEFGGIIDWPYETEK